MGAAAHPAGVTSNLDLRHETSDFGSNSILEILQFMMHDDDSIQDIHMKVPDYSLFTIARYRWSRHGRHRHLA